MLFLFRSKFQYSVFFVIVGVRILNLLGDMQDAQWNVTFERVLTRKGMKTRVAHMYFFTDFRPVTDECRHVFNKYVMLFGGILAVF